jgi:shikimate 5-dehydrogenase
MPVHEWGSDAACAAIASATLVVNTTPLGALRGEPSPIARAILAKGARAVDLRYAPATPAWLADAAALGHRVFDGRGLFVAQAARSLSFWFGRTPPLDRLRVVAGWDPDRVASNEV